MKRRRCATSRPGVRGPPRNLWTEKKTASRAAAGVARGVHVDIHVRAGRGEVEEGESAVAVEDARESMDVVQDPRHIRRGAERPDLPRPVRVLRELAVEILEADPSVRVERDVDGVADCLAPRDVVRVMLHERAEDDGTAFRGDAGGEGEALVELVRQPEAENVDEAVDRAGRAGTYRDQDVVLRRSDAGPDLTERILVHLRHELAREAALGVRVRHEGEDTLVQLFLDVAVEAAGGDEIEVAEGPVAEGSLNRRAGADDALAEIPEERGLLVGRGRDDGTSGRGGRRVDEAGRPGRGGQLRPPRRGRPRIASAFSRAPHWTPSQTIEQIFRSVGSAIE